MADDFMDILKQQNPGFQGGVNQFDERTRRVGAITDLLGQTGSGGDIATILSQDYGLGQTDREFAQSKSAIGRGAVIAEGFRVRDENNANRQRAQDFLTSNFERNTRTTITEDDINRMFAAEADRISAGAETSQDFLTGFLGSAGITGGGLAAGLASNLNLERLGQVTNARRDLRIFKAQQDFQDSTRNLTFGRDVASVLGRETDETGLAVLAEVLGVDMSVLGAEFAHEAASKAASAAEKAALIGGAGQIAGAGLGLLG